MTKEAPERLWIEWAGGEIEGVEAFGYLEKQPFTFEYLRADLVPRWSDDMVAAKKHEGPALLAWDDGRTLHSRKNASGTISHLAELPDYWMPLPAPPKGET